MASKAERDARLSKLATAITDWATKRRAYLNEQLSFSERVLKGRTGAERLTALSVGMAEELLVEEVGQFLTGA